MNTFYFWLWFFICIVSIVLEILTATALVSIWFALGSMIALGLALMNFSFPIQVIVFFISSLVLAMMVRPFATKYTRGNTVATNADRIISYRTKLLKPITATSYGEINFNGQIWNAASIDSKPIEAEALIEVIAIEGNKVLVKKL